jgi:hypothetical protein
MAVAVGGDPDAGGKKFPGPMEEDRRPFGRPLKAFCIIIRITERSWLGFDEMVAAYDRRAGSGTFSGTLGGTALVMALLFGGYLGHFRVINSAPPAPAAQHAAANPVASSLPTNRG